MTIKIGDHLYGDKIFYRGAFLLSVIIFVVGYALQAGLHEHLVETLVIILVLICFSIIFIPENKF